MKAAILLIASAVLASGCSRENEYGQRQTKMPGMITAGGGTSGEVIASQKKATDGSNAGGTPYHAGGAEGNSGGTATAGSVSESGHGPSGNTSPPAAKTTPTGQ